MRDQDATVAALLNKAARTDNPHEAEAFREAAVRISAKADRPLASSAADHNDGADKYRAALLRDRDYWMQSYDWQGVRSVENTLEDNGAIFDRLSCRLCLGPRHEAGTECYADAARRLFTVEYS